MHLTAAVTLRLERGNENSIPVLRLIGRIRSEHLAPLRAELRSLPPHAGLDLAEVTNLDVEAVRFLGACELDGHKLLNCSPFIREWIHREREMDEKS